VAAYAAAAPATALAFATTGTGCAYRQFMTDCDFDSHSFDPAAYGMIALVTAVAMVIVQLKAQHKVWYPIAMLFGTLLLATVCYDVVLRRPVIGADKIVDDTFNTLRFAIMASSLLVFLIARRVRMSIPGTIVTIVASNGAAIAVALVFREVSVHVTGTTKLYLLFLLYAFGGFGAHIMATSWLFSSGRMIETPPVAANEA
jgi:hypothetical protein